ncbi:MAG TPA: RlpA-like double-psi beta-barrel domain-containing protein, partial [Pseudolabrys sp.]|nr:RlpA-like double-psi beta-barrel domain-containing protein [Pseudolabrys sp.]
SIVVRVNDRGPYAANRILDVSRKTAKLLGFYGHGIARVRVDYVGRAPLRGSSDRELLATLRQHTPGEERPVMVASNASYTPTYFDSRPMREVLPPERPYGVSSAQQEVVAEADPPAASRTSTFELAANTKPQRALDRIKQVPMPPAEPQVAAEAPPSAATTEVASAHVSSVSAYAPVGYDGRAAGFMSGRGLY